MYHRCTMQYALTNASLQHIHMYVSCSSRCTILLYTQQATAIKKSTFENWRKIQTFEFGCILKFCSEITLQFQNLSHIPALVLFSYLGVSNIFASFQINSFHRLGPFVQISVFRLKQVTMQWNNVQIAHEWTYHQNIQLILIFFGSQIFGPTKIVDRFFDSIQPSQFVFVGGSINHQTSESDFRCSQSEKHALSLKKLKKPKILCTHDILHMLSIILSVAICALFCVKMIVSSFAYNNYTLAMLRYSRQEQLSYSWLQYSNTVEYTYCTVRTVQQAQSAK